MSFTDERELTSFNPKSEPEFDDTKSSKYTSVREFFGAEESVYIMDAKNTGNIGRFLNVSHHIFSYAVMLLICVPAFLLSQCFCPKCFCRHARRPFSVGCVLRPAVHQGRHRADVEL